MWVMGSNIRQDDRVFTCPASCFCLCCPFFTKQLLECIKAGAALHQKSQKGDFSSFQKAPDIQAHLWASNVVVFGTCVGESWHIAHTCAIP